MKKYEDWGSDDKRGLWQSGNHTDGLHVFKKDGNVFVRGVSNAEIVFEHSMTADEWERFNESLTIEFNRPNGEG